MTKSSSLHEARRRVELAYDPALLRDAGHRLADLLAQQLESSEESQCPVLPWRPPAENIADAASFLHQATADKQDPSALAERFGQLVQTMLSHGHNLHDPRYIGHQVAAPVPLAGLFEAVGSVTNQPMPIYEMGPWATASEWAMVQQLGRHIGWQEGSFSGLATHGGSLANLTALLAARNVRLKDSWQQGTAGKGPAPVLVAHADAHYSVARAAGIMGLGTRNVIRVGLDQRRRMDPHKLEEILRTARDRNQPVVAVVACACSTPIGAFDPLPEIAAICRNYDVWLHVDAAHGGAACMSPHYRHLVAGLEQCDSLVWDAHKMLFMPALCAFVFYRNAAHKYAPFQQDAPYLFDPAAPGLADFDGGLRTVECTKRAAAFGLWGVWALFGPQLFADMVDITFSMGRTFYEKLCAAGDFVPLHEPECNIVVFRHVPVELRQGPPDVLGRFQLELRRRVVESGEFYIVSTKIDGSGALRVTIINPLTRPEHLDQLLDRLREEGQRLLHQAAWPAPQSQRST